MIDFRIIAWFFLVSVGVTVPPFAMAQSAASFNRDGAEAFRQGDYDKAIECFRIAHEKNPGDLRLNYNLGAARAAQGDILQALNELSRPAEARDSAISQRARFAQGVLHLHDAQSKLERNDPQGAMQSTQKALIANRQVLMNDSQDVDARVNYELAWRLSQEIDQQIQEQEQKKKQDSMESDSPKDNQKDESDSAEEQESESQQNPSAESNPNETQPPPTPSPDSESPAESSNAESTPQPDAAPSSSPGDPETEPDVSQDAAESLLNLMDENDAEALKRMLRMRYGRVERPEKDW